MLWNSIRTPAAPPPAANHSYTYTPTLLLPIEIVSVIKKWSRSSAKNKKKEITHAIVNYIIYFNVFKSSMNDAITELLSFLERDEKGKFF